MDGYGVDGYGVDGYGVDGYGVGIRNDGGPARTAAGPPISFGACPILTALARPYGAKVRGPLTAVSL